MDFTKTLYTLSQADAEKPSLFPFPFGLHLVFVIISVLFFAYRFTIQKKPYQLIMGSAILISMGLWISESRAVYYGVGAIEAVLVIAAIVTSIVIKDNDTESDDDSDDDNDDSDSGDDEDTDEDEMTAINAANTVNNILNN